MIYLLVALLALLALAATAPVVLFIFNLRRYRTPHTGKTYNEHVAVLIPARNEEDNIGACVASVLTSRDIDISVWVCDDGSDDNTPNIVAELAAADPRVHLLHCAALPAGWNGKQHACWKLARHAANHSLLLFLDADVRLHRWTIARSVHMLRAEQVALLSGFPRQVYSGWLDRLLLPLIQFVLLSYLPLRWMEQTLDPKFAAGCGQFLLVDCSAYFASGGHAEIRESRHDGLRLPRLLREHGFPTGLADLTRLADVHMYSSAGATWNGLAKNATEGIAARGRIVPFTLLLLFTAVLPGLVLYALVAEGIALLLMYFVSGAGVIVSDPGASATIGALALLAGLAAFLPRLIAVRRFKQPLWSALLHPLGVILLLILQWHAWLRERLGKPVDWRTRAYSTDTGSEVDYTSSYRT